MREPHNFGINLDVQVVGGVCLQQIVYQFTIQCEWSLLFALALRAGFQSGPGGQCAPILHFRKNEQEPQYSTFMETVLVTI